MNNCKFCNNFSIIKLCFEDWIQLQFEIIMKQPLLHATVSRDKISSTVSGLQRWTPISYQFNKYRSFPANHWDKFPPYWFSKRHMSCSAFQWYENPILKVSSPLEHPCWWKDLLNVTSLHIDSAKVTCLVPLSNGTKIPHWRYQHRWNILLDERNSWM